MACATGSSSSRYTFKRVSPRAWLGIALGLDQPVGVSPNSRRFHSAQRATRTRLKSIVDDRGVIAWLFMPSLCNFRCSPDYIITCRCRALVGGLLLVLTA